MSVTFTSIDNRMAYLPPKALRLEDEEYYHSLDVFSLGVIIQKQYRYCLYRLVYYSFVFHTSCVSFYSRSVISFSEDWISGSLLPLMALTLRDWDCGHFHASEPSI